jgi:tetratricopeptide (TPR) repeat protein
MTPGQIAFEKALFLLDRGQYPRGEVLLRQSLSLLGEEGKDVERYRAICALGELLYELERHDEAIPLLLQVASLVRGQFDDLLDYEIERARMLLACNQK